MVSGYIIERYDDMSEGYTCNRLMEEGRKLGMDLDIIGVYDTCISGRSVYNGGEKLEHRDFSVIRHRPCQVRDAVIRLTDRSYNDREGFDRYLNKHRQLLSLRTDHMYVPRYTVSTSCISYDYLSGRFCVPFIAKGLEGSRGDSVHLISSEEDYQSLREEHGLETEWLFQQFIDESRGKDLRLFAVKGEAVACMKRTNNRDFRANYALGAKLAPYKIDRQLRDIAEDVYRSTGLDVMGIDLLMSDEGYAFCEVNVMPGLKGIESVTGVNIASLIMKSIEGDVRG